MRGCHPLQVFLQSGRSPTLLQLLCNLPFEYFSSPRYASPVLSAVVEFAGGETHTLSSVQAVSSAVPHTNQCLLPVPGEQGHPQPGDILPAPGCLSLLPLISAGHVSDRYYNSLLSRVLCVCPSVLSFPPFSTLYVEYEAASVFIFMYMYRFAEPVRPGLPLPTVELATSCRVLLSMTIIYSITSFFVCFI